MRCHAVCSYLQQRRNKQGPAFTYEIIIVDDGSKDATAKVAFGYVRTHGIDAVRLLRLPQNCGKVGCAGHDIILLDTTLHLGTIRDSLSKL